MKSEKEIKELTFRLKILHEGLTDIVNQIARIADELGDEDASKILITDVYVQVGDDEWHPEDMNVWEWIGELNDCVRWVEIKEANRNEQAN